MRDLYGPLAEAFGWTPAQIHELTLPELGPLTDYMAKRAKEPNG